MPTPTQHGHGVPVHGIELRDSFEKQAALLALNRWPSTPPQTARELKGRSITYPTFSDALEPAPSSEAGSSQPVTPVHNMGHSLDRFAQHWSDGVDVQVDLTTSLNDGCALGQAQPPFSDAFHQQAMCGTTGVIESPIYAPACRTSYRDAPTIDVKAMAFTAAEHWIQPHESPKRINLHVCDPEATLFQTVHDLDHENALRAALYPSPAPSMAGSLEQSSFPHCAAGGTTSTSFMHPHVRTVVPSQLSPHEDYSTDPCPAYAPDDHVPRSFSGSFDSASIGFSGWQSAAMESPVETYFDCSDEDAMITVKDEHPETPPGDSTYDECQLPTPSHERHQVKRAPLKRSRKASAHNKAWFEGSTSFADVRFEGSPFIILEGPPGGRPRCIPLNAKQAKPHHCMHKDKNGVRCGQSFERSEHLKRHMGSHSDVRPFPCPLKGCIQKIGRPDNASDHFKTHLRGPSKGQRNNHCSFEELADALLAHKKYTEKMATKILTKLSKWVATELEKAPENANERTHGDKQKRLEAGGRSVMC